MRAEIWRWWEKAVGTAVFSRIFSHLFPPFRSISHLFPPFPTSFFISWPSGAGWEMEGWIIGAVGGAEWEDAAGRGADLCGKKCGLLREGSRKFAKVRTEQARKSAIVRIVTG